MSKIATIIGSVAGALAFVILVIGFFWFCKSQFKNLSNRNPETVSSDPSALVEWKEKLDKVHLMAGLYLHYIAHNSSQWKSWSKLQDNSVKVTLLDVEALVKHIKKFGNRRNVYDKKVVYLSKIRHPNLVCLLGYCQESGSQIVYEYLPNDSMCNHLYNTGLDLSTRLEFKQRLTIAMGAAIGPCHLHSLKPPLVHRNFQTADVLVDENFIAKVADAGVLRILEKIEYEHPSCTSTVDILQDLKIDFFWFYLVCTLESINPSPISS
ncbi:hypothetical protein SLA2020_023850 [Shorea laevis]